MGTPDVRVEFQTDPSASAPDRITHLEDYVRQLPDVFTSLNTNIVRLDRAIVEAPAYADTAAAQAKTHADGKIQEFTDPLDEAQAADLRVAAVGVLISMVGIMLGYWA